MCHDVSTALLLWLYSYISVRKPPEEARAAVRLYLALIEHVAVVTLTRGLELLAVRCFADILPLIVLANQHVILHYREALGAHGSVPGPALELLLVRHHD